MHHALRSCHHVLLQEIPNLDMWLVVEQLDEVCSFVQVDLGERQPPWTLLQGRGRGGGRGGEGGGLRGDSGALGGVYDSVYKPP